MRWPAALAVTLALAACASTSTTSDSTSSAPAGTSTGAGAKACDEPCVLFNVQVSFAGLDNITGSFVDNTSGTGFSSCSEWVTGDSVGFAQGPGTPTHTDTKIDGKSLSFGFEVGHDQFHGPGMYSNTLLEGVTIGSDTFLGNSDTETLNADGSGHVTFSNLSGGSVTGPQGAESGTVTWTCSH